MDFKWIPKNEIWEFMQAKSSSIKTAAVRVVQGLENPFVVWKSFPMFDSTE